MDYSQIYRKTCVRIIKTKNISDIPVKNQPRLVLPVACQLKGRKNPKGRGTIGLINAKKLIEPTKSLENRGQIRVCRFTTLILFS